MPDTLMIIEMELKLSLLEIEAPASPLKRSSQITLFLKTRTTLQNPKWVHKVSVNFQFCTSPFDENLSMNKAMSDSIYVTVQR